MSTPWSDKAFEWAASAHQGQVDKIGEPYLGHPKRIVANLEREGYGDKVLAVGWLHDVVEDSAVTLEQLRETGFPDDVVDAVDAISKRPHEKFESYYDRVKSNHMATVVKWFDVQDNADPRRLAKVAPDTQERLRAKYERAREALGAKPTLPDFD